MASHSNFKPWHTYPQAIRTGNPNSIPCIYIYIHMVLSMFILCLYVVLDFPVKRHLLPVGFTCPFVVEVPGMSNGPWEHDQPIAVAAQPRRLRDDLDTPQIGDELVGSMRSVSWRKDTYRVETTNEKKMF